jgi:hypothetical protein
MPSKPPDLFVSNLARLPSEIASPQCQNPAQLSFRKTDCHAGSMRSKWCNTFGTRDPGVPVWAAKAYKVENPRTQHKFGHTYPATSSMKPRHIHSAPLRKRQGRTGGGSTASQWRVKEAVLHLCPLPEEGRQDWNLAFQGGGMSGLRPWRTCCISLNLYLVTFGDICLV